MPQKFPRWLIAIVAVVIALSLLGFLWRLFFWSTLQKTFKNPLTGSITYQGDTPEGKIDMKQGKPGLISLPDDFPKESEYPGWKVTSVYKIPNSNGSTTTYVTWVAGQTNDSMEKVFKYYKNYFAKNGWTVMNEIQNENSLGVSANSGPKSLYVDIKQDNETKKTVLTIAY